MGSTFIGSPIARHAVAEESDSRQLGHRLDDVEVAERADLEERHVVLCGEVLRVRLTHFASEGKVQTVANQDLGNARCVLKYKSNSQTHYHLSAKTLDGLKAFISRWNTALLRQLPSTNDRCRRTTTCW